MKDYWNVGSTLGYWYSYHFSVERGDRDLFVLLRDLLDRRGRQLHSHPHRPHQQEDAGDHHHHHNYHHQGDKEESDEDEEIYAIDPKPEPKFRQQIFRDKERVILYITLISTNRSSLIS